MMHSLLRLVRSSSALLPKRSLLPLFPFARFSAAAADPEFQPSKLKIFDWDLKRKKRDRAAWLMGNNDALLDVVAENLLDRLQVEFKSFL